MFQRDRERSLDCNHRVTTNQSTNQKPSPLGEGGADRHGRGELALKPRLPHNQRTYPSDCEAGARKSRPLWGKGTALAVEGGNSLSN